MHNDHELATRSGLRLIWSLYHEDATKRMKPVLNAMGALVNDFETKLKHHLSPFGPAAVDQPSIRFEPSSLSNERQLQASELCTIWDRASLASECMLTGAEPQPAGCLHTSSSCLRRHISMRKGKAAHVHCLNGRCQQNWPSGNPGIGMSAKLSEFKAKPSASTRQHHNKA